MQVVGRGADRWPIAIANYCELLPDYVDVDDRGMRRRAIGSNGHTPLRATRGYGHNVLWAAAGPPGSHNIALRNVLQQWGFDSQKGRRAELAEARDADCITMIGLLQPSPCPGRCRSRAGSGACGR